MNEISLRYELHIPKFVSLVLSRVHLCEYSRREENVDLFLIFLNGFIVSLNQIVNETLLSTVVK